MPSSPTDKATARITVVGGPLDGLSVRATHEGAHVWIDTAGRRRFHNRSGAVLHQQLSGRYVHKPWDVQCGSCGGYQPRPVTDQACRLCGGAL